MKEHSRPPENLHGRSRLTGRAVAVLIVMAVVVSSLVACSSSVPVSAGVTPPAMEARPATPPAVVKEVFASVLITEADAPIGVLERVAVTPLAVVADSGETVKLTARAFLAKGQRDTSVDLIWTLTDIRAGSLNSRGEFTAGAIPGVYPGAISVTAVNETAEGLTRPPSWCL